ncbi:hypothetical protein AYO44_14770 [Planctomycetaceae bacterium SCGC AG-212-F19]|nr:hypothetical protein AYO44_14770 [Planctomycetaceae bacterium SCGC AG-212-F19]
MRWPWQHQANGFLTRNHLSARFIIRGASRAQAIAVRPCSGQGGRIARQQRQAIDGGGGQVVQLSAAIDCHRQLGVAVPRQLHCLFERSPGPVQKRDVRMPHRVKVSVEWAIRAIDHVGDAGRLKVDAEHFRGVLEPQPWPNRLAGRPCRDVAAERPRHRRRDRLGGLLSVLGHSGGQGHGRRDVGQREGCRRQAGQLAGAESRRHGSEVEEIAVVPCQATEQLRAALRCFQNPYQFYGRQGAPVVPAVQLGVATLQVSKRVIGHAVVAHQPSGECLDFAEVIVRGLDALPTGFHGQQDCGGLLRVPPGFPFPFGRKLVPADHGRDR